MEVVKVMIHDQDISMYLWVEVARTTIYVKNQIPHRVIENRTLEEIFSGEIPKVSHLRIFGCSVYIHVSKDKRSKLDPSGKKGIFVGYNETSKGYKIYVPSFKKIEISRDATFDEDATFRKSKKNALEEVQDEDTKSPRGS